MRSVFQLLTQRFDRRVCSREVEEELQFHIEMRARDYERAGLSPEDSLAKAHIRFGDFPKIKRQCIEIGLRSSLGIWVQKGLFTFAFLLGVLIRSLDHSVAVTRMGDVLIMIAVFGGLLMLGKRVRMRQFWGTQEPVRLGLRSPDSEPVAFDENGRTPFERVRADLS
ncbi:MAG TPA: permease prefix domain 1-containing protein [Pyrinomonadaceae bacterium]|nr:permease prefix domain 1-containing protein [Pyrinomonadaceae bacterium]